MIGIYKMTNRLNGKVYIGSTSNSKVREELHFKNSMIKQRKHLPLYSEMILIGKENFVFEMIEECEVSEIEEKEAYYIAKYNSTINGYNTVTTTHPMHDEKFREQNSKRLTEWNKEMWQDKEYRAMKSKESSKLQKERLKSPKYLAEKSAQLKQYTDSIKKPVGQYDKQGNLIAVFDGVREAERETGIDNSAIARVARGDKYRKTAKGFVWKYL